MSNYQQYRDDSRMKPVTTQVYFGTKYSQRGNYTRNQTNYRTPEYNSRDNYKKNHYERRDNTSENPTFLTITSDKVGKIIGRQGSTIKDLQSTTRTRISVGKEDYDGNVTITITGQPAAQEECKLLIEKLVSGYSHQSFSFTNNQEERKNQKPKEAPLIDWDAALKSSEEYQRMQDEIKYANYPPLKKDFYIEDPYVSNMSEEYVRNLRKSMNNITVSNVFGSSKKIPNPVETFVQAFREFPEIMDEIDKQGFPKPFPIQSQAWPILLSGNDMIGIAQTGTGKTLAFLLPALIHMEGQEIPMSERGKPGVLVLAPTRELALQIKKEVDKYSYHNIQSVCVYGGGNRQEQINIIKKGVNIIIGTPGRLNDLVEAGVIDIDSITFLILDEADRMLDMGFEPQIRKILLDLRKDRQTVMTSATWPFSVQSLAEKYMNEPIQVVVGSLDLAAVHSVKQTVLIVPEDEKKEYLLDFLSNLDENDKVIIFVDKKALADSLSSSLILQNIECQCIHGNLDQCDREQAIDDLKSGSVRILVATDVASRGIDISDVTKVLNYDFPRNVEEYVHRVGRTGRAGKTGEALTFFSRRDWSSAKELISILEEADQPVPRELYEMKDRYQAWVSKKSEDRNFRRPDRSSNRW